MGRNSSSKNYTAAFTLIELLVAVAIIGVLAIGAISVVNPVAQFQKAQDAQRKSDLSQIQKALETYYNDHNAYPISSPPFGSNWSEGSTVYMGKVPNDPSYGQTYSYKTNSSSPQWAVIYAILNNTAGSCSLKRVCGCNPSANLTCVIMGIVDCTKISKSSCQ